MELPNISEMMAALKDSTRTPLDSIPIPRDHVLEFLTLLQRLKDAKREGDGAKRANFALWNFVARVLPYTKGKNCGINVKNATIPIIDIHGELPKDVVGKKRVLGMYSIPRERIYRMLELMDLEDNGPLHRYNLWEYIASIIPEVAAKPDGSWEIASGDDEITIIERAPEEGE